MMETSDPRIDRLYRLLPAIYRARDAEHGYALQALLRVIAEQVNVVEDDIARLYENWFVETAEDWAVPYLGELVGYRPVAEAGSFSDGKTDDGRTLNRVLVPRREVAGTIPYRRRKGTLALLDRLTEDVAGWPSRAVEFYRLLGWNQNLNHRHTDRARTVDVRRVERLNRLDGPFDRLGHTVDIRRIGSHRTQGRHNIPSVGVYIWRLGAYSITAAPALCVGDPGDYCYAFSVLGQDVQLVAKPVSGELRPSPISRIEFERHPDRYYGEGKSLAVWANGWQGIDEGPIPASRIVVADLSDWRYIAPPGKLAVDPVLGRLAFPPDELPPDRVRVTYHYGFLADMGGGEYLRPIHDPCPRLVEGALTEATVYRVGEGQEFGGIGEALGKWKQDDPLDAVIEVTDSDVYVEPVRVQLKEGRTLHLRAAVGTRPTIQAVGRHIDRGDSLSVTMGEASRFVLEGFLVTGRALQVNGPAREEKSDIVDCGGEFVIRHCTLVPGWDIDRECEPAGPGKPSLELNDVRASVRIEHSILGPIRVSEDEVHADPISLTIRDSILDATDRERIALSGPGGDHAHVVLTIRQSTVIGVVEVHAIDHGDDSIFLNCLNVARRQLGCLRFCYVPPGCRTPRRYRCQPDLVVQAANQSTSDPAEQTRRADLERRRVEPQFESLRYGGPRYTRLALWAACEIARGAEDESEMGAYHDLYEPQRLANLRARLSEFTPAGMDVGVLFAD